MFSCLASSWAISSSLARLAFASSSCRCDIVASFAASASSFDVSASNVACSEIFLKIAEGGRSPP